VSKREYTDRPMHSEHRRADARYLDKDLATQCLHAGERWEKQYFAGAGDFDAGSVR
jgi:hypothetical protein